MRRERVVVAMSGGVDSSVAAVLLKEAGYEVIGITMQIWPVDKTVDERDGFHDCCGLEAVESAKRTAYKLGIPHYVMNFRDDFSRWVIADFCQEYSLGRTPNPCIRCNQYIKFDALLKKAQGLDASFLATGHYARLELSNNGYRLLKAVDQAKDQSYFLYTIGQKELQHLLLPIGNLHKAEVRKIAAKLDLPAATRDESQDICFIPDNDYRSFITGHIPLKSGDVVDTEGRVLGKHRGLACYTIGQRQGLGLASGKRLYVLKLDADNNRLIVGPEEQLLASTFVATNLTWVSGEAPAEALNLTAKVRYKSTEVTATLHLNGRAARVMLHQPQRAITPGQSVVFYQGDAILGGGIIEDVECATDTIPC
ncbi:tRNA 2-thiouridine(34) synthase MnmA [Chloroflexota bacterium]